MAIERARARTSKVERLGDLEQLGRERPGDLRVRLALAEEYVAQGYEIEARTELAFLLQSDPSLREKLSPRLTALIEPDAPGDREDMLAELERIRTMPNIADRIAGYRAATQRFPDAAPVWFNLATDLERSGDTRAASEAMRQALMLDPKLGVYLPPEFHTQVEHGLEPWRGLRGTRIERYTIERIVAVHESQVLCEASGVSQDTPVILRHLTGIPAAQAKAMLQDELHVERLEQLVPVLDLVYDEQRRPYQVLAHFSGPSLSELRRAGVLTVDEKLETMCAVLRALGELHRRGLVHGDLRPEHVLRVSQSPLRIQFLGARGSAGSERVLPREQAAWAAPEETNRVDARTDIYCAGLLLYHLFGESSLPSLRERAREGLPLLGAVSGSLSRIDRVIRRCTERDPLQRYASCDEVLQALRGIIEEVEDLSGQLLDHYRLQRVLGRGGFATVYLAEDLEFSTRTAVKVLRSALAGSGDRRQRFFNEVHAAKRVNHPSIIRMDSAGSAGERHYLAMELLENGLTLGALLEQERLDLDAVLAIGIQLASGLQALHQASVIHRDVTPKNVFVARDRAGRVSVKIFDLGIAKIGGDPTPWGTPVTTYGERMGTLGYMAPEQYHMDPPVDPRADVYSLGAVLYQCITGRPPFPEGHVGDWDEAYRCVEASAFDAALAMPEKLQQLVLQMLSVNRDNRPANMSEVEERLHRIEHELHAPPPPPEPLVPVNAAPPEVRPPEVRPPEVRPPEVPPEVPPEPPPVRRVALPIVAGGLVIIAILFLNSVHEARQARQALQRTGIAPTEDSLFQAAGDGDIRTARLLLTAGVPPDSWGVIDAHTHASTDAHPHPDTPKLRMVVLARAALASDLEIVRELLKRGASLDAGAIVLAGDVAAGSGTTPLMFAVRYGKRTVSAPIVQELLERGASVNARNARGRSAIFLARHRDTAQLLIQYGAAVNAKDHQGITPLMEAAAGGFVEVMDVLLTAGARHDERMPDGKTALHWVAELGNVKAAQRLVRAGAMVDSLTRDGDAPLHLAVTRRNKPIIEALLRAGATVDARALQLAQASPDIRQILVASQGDR